MKLKKAIEHTEIFCYGKQLWQEDLECIKTLLNELERLQKENSNISRELIARTDELNKLLEENEQLDEKCEYQAKFIEKIEANIGHKGMTKTELAFVCASLEYDNEELEEDLKNSIPKQVIRDKIEEKEKELKEYDLEEYCLYEDTIQERIKILKELLKEK